MSGNQSEFAQVEILPAEFARKILSARSIDRIRTLYGVIFPLAVIAGVGLFVLAGISNREGIDNADTSKSTLAIILCSFGIITFGILLAIRLVVGHRDQWLRRIARSEVNRRPNKSVNPDAPGVRFVEIVPKSNWSDTTLLENATDVGFLAIDFQKGFLLFEGDNECYRIPAKAIVKCEQDSYTRLVQSPYTKVPSNMTIYYHFVVVTIKVSEQMTVEVPFRIRKTVSLWSDKKAREANYDFLREINRLKPTFKVTA
jgi:hypothetical protein